MCGLNDSCVATKGIFVQSAVDIGLIQPPIDYGTGPSPQENPRPYFPFLIRNSPFANSIIACQCPTICYDVTRKTQKRVFWQPFFCECRRSLQYTVFENHIKSLIQHSAVTIWVDNSSWKMPKMLHFGEFLKAWSLRSNSVTRQVNFNRTKISGKYHNLKNQMWHFE